MSADSGVPVAESEDPEYRLRMIEAVTDSALAHLDLEQLLVELLERVRELLSVDTAAVLLNDAPSNHLYAGAAVGLEEEVRSGVRVPIGTGFAGKVAATKEPLVTDRVDASTVVNPLLWERGLQVLLGVPMLAAGQLVGVLQIGSRAKRTFTATDVHLLQMVADRMALAARAQMSAVERGAAIALQRSLLPSRLPSVRGMEFGARYVPGGQTGVSGDWYDAFTLPGGRLGVVIGDVVGHGLSAAVVMGRLRSALRAYALDDDNPARVLDKLDRKALHFEAGSMTTVGYGVVEPDSRSMRLSLAGHLPPVQVLPGKPAELLDVPVDPPIGFGPSVRHRRQSVLELPADSLLCLYTDGLIERRGTPIDTSLELLREAIDIRPAEDLCTQLLRRFVGATETEDDIAILVLRRVTG